MRYLIHSEPRAAGTVEVTDDRLSVELDDGRTKSVPLGWYPRLLHATQTERDNHRLIGNGEGIHWPDLDQTPSLTIERGLPDSNENKVKSAAEIRREYGLDR